MTKSSFCLLLVPIAEYHRVRTRQELKQDRSLTARTGAETVGECCIQV